MLRRLAILAAVALGALVPVAGAHAASSVGTLAASTAAPQQDVGVPLFPVTNAHLVPPFFTVSAGQALAEAKATPEMQRIHRAHHPLIYVVLLMPRSHFEVDFFFHGKPLATVLVWPNGQVKHVYTGPLVLGLYARGNYSEVFDKAWVWLPLGLLFLLPIVLLRGLSRMDRLDLAAVLTFGISYALFDATHLEPGVWAAYPPLVYLLVRMLWRGFRGQQRPRALSIGLPTGVLIGGVALLFAARVAMAMAPGQVMDVGYASMIGAFKMLHGQPIYFPSVGHPDTYGPVNYLAYVPFELIWPVKSWAGFVPGARFAALSFDLITIGGLILLGRRLAAGRAGLRLGLVLAWLWAACPFTALNLIKSSNDGLVAMFMVLVLLALAKPVRRGVLIGLAAAAKFTPAILLGVVAVGPRAERTSVRKTLAGCVIAAGVMVALFLPPGGLQEMWQHTIGFQLSRPDIFSPWALHPSLAPIKDLITLGVIALAVLCAWRPRGPRSLAQVSALTAALTIGIELPAQHWFYLYIPWFMPLVLVAVIATPVAGAARAAVAGEPASVLADPDPEPELAGAV